MAKLMRLCKKFFAANLSRRKKSCFWVVLAAALFLRWWGAAYGLPLVFNIDEPALVRSTIGLRFHANPGHFDWPHFHYYVNFVFYTGLYLVRGFIQVLGLRNWVEGIFPLGWQDPAIFYLISRLVNGVLGALTLVPLYLAAKELLGERKAFLAAAILAVIPLHVAESHLATLDVALTFWVAGYLYTSVRAYRTGKLTDYLAAGALLGLAASTKYQAVLLAPYLVILHLARSFNGKEGRKESLRLAELSAGKPAAGVRKLLSGVEIKKIGLAGITAAVFFFLGTPFALFDFDTFFSDQPKMGALWQFENIGRVERAEYLPQLYDNTTRILRESLSLPLLLIILLNVVLLLFFNRRKLKDILNIGLPLVLFLYASSLDRSPGHYFIFLYPMWAMSIADLVVDGLELAAKVVGRVRLRTWLWLGSALLLAAPLYQSLAASYRYSREDTRTIAYAWLRTNARKPQKLYFYGEPLESLPYDDIDETKLKRVDPKEMDLTGLPFYLMIGVPNLSRERLLYGQDGDRDLDDVPGNIARATKVSELVFEVQPTGRFGPPVYIFRVYDVERTK